MRLFLTLVLFIFCSCTSRYSSTSIPIDLSRYELAWEDNFEFLDKKKWKLDPLEKRHDAFNSLKSVKTQDGFLTITTQTINSSHHTAILTTEGLFEASYGYYEAKIKFNNPSGTWSAFWLYSQSVSSVVNDIHKGGMEIAIVEHRNLDNDGRNIFNTPIHSLHWNTYIKGFMMNVGKDSPVKIGKGFHTYALLWTPEEYKFFVDGYLSWAVKPTTSKKQFIILSSEVSDNLWSGPILEKYDHEGLVVDYVRYYKPLDLDLKL